MADRSMKNTFLIHQPFSNNRQSKVKTAAKRKEKRKRNIKHQYWNTTDNHSHLIAQYKTNHAATKTFLEFLEVFYFC